MLSSKTLYYLFWCLSAVKIHLFHHSFYPHVNRKCCSLSQREQCDTARDLSTYTLYLHQFFKTFRNSICPEPPFINTAFLHTAYRIPQIWCPEACFARSECFNSRITVERITVRKCIIFMSGNISEICAVIM